MDDLRRITNRCYIKAVNDHLYLIDIKNLKVLAIFDKILNYNPNSGILTVSINIDGVYQNYTIHNVLSGNIHFYGDMPVFDNEWELYNELPNGSNIVTKNDNEDYFALLEKASRYMDRVAKKRFDEKTIPPLFNNQTYYNM
jgi:hypothetical protein